MAGISTSISLHDGLTSVVRNMYSSVNMLATSLQRIDVISETSASAIVQSMSSAVAELSVLENSIANVGQTVQRMSEWNRQRQFNVFGDNGTQRLTQEVNDFKNLINQVAQAQEHLKRRALGVSILPLSARGDILSTNNEVNKLISSMEQLKNIDKDKLSSSQVAQVNKEYENMRATLTSVLDLQASIRNNIGSNNVSGMNSGFNQLRSSVEQAQMRVRDLTQNLQQMTTANWSSIATPQVFDTTGIQRARQEFTDLQSSVTRVLETQNNLAQRVTNMRLVPPNAVSEITNINLRISSISNTIARLESEKNKLSRWNTSGINNYNSRIESLRNQMHQIEIVQNEINVATRNNDIQRLNSGYQRLEGIVRAVETDIRQNNNAQREFNGLLGTGTTNASSLLGKIKSMASVYLSFQGLKNIFTQGFELNKIKSQFQARLGDKDAGTFLFNKIQEQASKSAFGISELARNTASFLSVVNKESQLDGLNRIAEKLALFDTTGQGLAGAGFSVKEALSGDIISLADRFNMSKSLIRSFKINELGKNGNIDEFIEQFNKLLEVQRMGESAYKQMLEDPKIQLDMFISNMKTGLATASQLALTSLSSVIKKFNDWFSSDNATKFFKHIENAFSMLVNTGLAVWGVLSNIVNNITNNWNTIQPILTGIANGFVAIKLAVEGIKLYSLFNAISLLNNFSFNALTVSLSAVGIVAVGVGIGFGILARKVGGIGNAILILKNSMLNIISGLKLTISNAVMFWVNAFYQLRTAIEEIPSLLKYAFFKGCSLALQGVQKLVNGALELLGKFNAKINETFGTNFKTSFAGINLTGITNKLDTQANSAVRQLTFLDDRLQAIKKSTAELFNQQLISEGNAIMQRNNEVEMALRKTYNIDNDETKININDFLANKINLDNLNDVGKVGEIGKVNSKVDIQSEDLKFLKDIAEQEAVNQFTTKMVVPDVKITFTGDIKETADTDVIANVIKENILNELTAGAEFAHI